MIEFQDYVFVPKVNAILDTGVFVGTQKYLFFFPLKIETHEYRKIITTEFSFKGKLMDEALHEIIQLSKNINELEEQLISMAEENHDVNWHKIDDLGSFKVEVNFFGSGIHTNISDRKVGFKPFVQKLGKNKKEIKAFYFNHPKRK